MSARQSRQSRLATLLRIRRVEEELSRARLGAAVATERRAGHALDEARAQYAGAAPAAGDGAVEAFLAHRTHLQGRATRVVTAGAALARAGSDSAEARGQWSQAAMRLTALERLADRAREAQRLEQLAADQRTAEEAAAAARGGVR